MGVGPLKQKLQQKLQRPEPRDRGSLRRHSEPVEGCMNTVEGSVCEVVASYSALVLCPAAPRAATAAAAGRAAAVAPAGCCRSLLDESPPCQLAV